MNTKQLLVKYRVWILLVGFVAIISVVYPRFLVMSNLFNVLRQTSVNAVVAAGMTFAILTGGIDISVGSSMAFAGAVGAWMVLKGYPIALILVVTLLIGVATGIINGVLIAKAKLQPFIATLVTQTVLRGATLVFTSGRPISFSASDPAGAAFKWIGAGSVGVIPVPVIIMIFVFGILYFLLNDTAFGRYIYAVGGNEESARLSGVNTDVIKIKAYVISGIMTAIGAMIVTARLTSAQPGAGEGYELDAIAAVVLGGTSMLGGQGTILGTVAGALIIGILNNALNLMDVSSYYQTIIKGLVILFAVLLDKREK